MQVLGFLKLYWKAIFVITYPIILLTIFLFSHELPYRCLYVVVLMAGLWICEAIPLAVTSMIPIVLFPLLGILDTNKVCINYMKETNMMFIGGLIIAIAVEHCKLHTRIALLTIRCVGCSPKRLNLGLMFITMFVSMWVSNTAATAMMIPIVQATLEELQAEGIAKMFEDDPEADEFTRKPTRITMCYFISTAYSATIGGTGCLVGTGTNLTFKGIYETLFSDGEPLDFLKWIILSGPIMLLTMVFAVLWLQFWYLGLFRPNSNDAKNVEIGEEGKQIATRVINDKLKSLGPMTFHEWAVGCCFVAAILLWVTKRPEFMPGWAEQITDLKVKDSTPAMFIVIIMFILPSHLGFLKACSKDETKRPTEAAPALITWKTVQQKIPWGLVFLMGGGFVIAEGAKSSGMSRLVANELREFVRLPKIQVMIISCCFASIITQILTSNVATANILLPVVSEMTLIAKIHPLYLMMPTALTCSHAYCLPISTPPNALAAAPCNMSSFEMIQVGLGMIVVSMTVLLILFPILGPIVMDFEGFPDWAVNSNATNSTGD